MDSSVYFVLLLSLIWGDCSSLIIEECVKGSGVPYRGQQHNSSSGSLCLNWTSTDRDYDVIAYPDLSTGVGDHNYCRNPDDSNEPWCFVSGADGHPQREACAIEACQDEAAIIEKDRSGEGGAEQPVVGVSQRVRTGPKKKKDLGTIGYVLGIIMVTILIVVGVGITLGYFYKRGCDLKKKHEQHVYEREMHRITLPFSAFANPTCELVDENAIVVSAEPNVQAPSQSGVEGSDPLMDSAGTPGA